MTSPAAPIPVGMSSSFAALQSLMYRAYSTDPLSANAITWTVASGSSAYLTVSGVTATLYIATGGSNTSSQFNLANDGTDARPTISDLVTWMSSNLLNFLGAGNYTCTAVLGFASLSALVLVEDFAPAPSPIQAATSLNYLQTRLMAILFDLMAADTANMLIHLSPQGSEGMWLDWMGAFYGLPRLSTTVGGVSTVESDDKYRTRALAMLTQPQENNIAVAQILAEAFGVGNIQVVDAAPGTVTIWIFSPISQPSLAVPLAHKVLPAGIGVTCFLFTPGTSAGALCGRVRCGGVRCGSGSNFTILR